MNTTPTTPELPTRWVKVGHQSPAHIAERYPYCAYGSNLLLDQMARRCPDAEIVGAGHIPNCRLLFAYYAGIAEHPGVTTPVAVYQLNARAVAAMDRFEGHPRHYVRTLVTVTMADGTLRRCFTYLKIDNRIEPPNARYYTVCRDGYRDWHFDIDILQAAQEYARHNDYKRIQHRSDRHPMDYSNWEPLGANGYIGRMRHTKRRRKNDDKREGVSLVTGCCRTCGEVHKELLCPSLNLVKTYVEDSWKQRNLPVIPLADPARTSVYDGSNQNIFEGRDGQLWRKDSHGIWRRVEDV